MDEQIKQMLSKKVWAVVGATENPSKYGNKIYKKLKRFGYEVYAVNPNYTEVDGDICYASLSDLPKKVDCVDVVVAPKFAQKSLEEVIELSIENIWFQPDTFTVEMIDQSEAAGINTVYLNCVLVELDRQNG